MSGNKSSRSYLRPECAVFRKTDEAFGGLSNMAPGFPVRVNGIRVMTIEALYQASRFPHLAEVQRLIIDQHSPMTAKMVSKPHRQDSRDDWENVKVKVMRWCLRVKLSQHWSKFSQLLLSTGDRSIVEDSRKDDFWGAIPTEGDSLVGLNVLGRLLMELREAIKEGAELRRVEPPAIPNFLLFGEPLQVVDFGTDKSASPVATDTPAKDSFDELTLPLFDEVVAATPTAGASRNASRRPAERRSAIIEGLKPYAEYKESELPWLKALPCEWRVRRGRGVFECVDVRSKTGSEELLSVSASDGVRRRSEKAVTMFQASSYAGHKLAWPGDLVINSLWAWMKGLGFSKYHGIVSTAYGVYRPRPEHRAGWHYFNHLFRSSAYDWELRVRSKGIWISRMQLTDWSFLDMPVLLPPPDEQAAIVRFLDYANGRLERAIRAKRKVIALLHEQKQAIIHRAVTGQIDVRTGKPYPAYKPSLPAEASAKAGGIPWLGDIPKQWEMRRLRFCIRGKLTYGANAAAEFGNPDWPRYLRITDFSADGSLRPDTFRSLPPAVAKDYLVEDGDILFARSGATVGKAFLVRTDTVKACFAGYLIRARPDTRVVLPTFLFAFTQSTAFARWKDAIFNQATIQNIGADKYANLSVPIPPLLEQQAILESVETEVAPIRAASGRIEREIALLREYRTRLVADVVTGKLDVRPLSACLPARGAQAGLAQAGAVRHLPAQDAECAPDLPDESEISDESGALESAPAG